SDVVCPGCGERVPAHFGKCWKCQAELSEAAPAAPSRSSRAKCTWCEGTDFALGVAVGSGEAGRRLLPQAPTTVGLLYAGGSSIRDLQGGNLEVLRADLCKDCGTILRFYVDEVDRLWLKHD